MFKGLFTALVTPFKYGELDLEAFKKIIEWQISKGVDGLVVAGSTGEAHTLSQQEHLLLIKKAIEYSQKKVPIVAATGTNSTAKTVEISLEAKKLGVDGIMVIAPYYNKPGQEGIYQHFKMVNDMVKLPIIIYNNPSRTSVNIADDTIIRLASLEYIVSIKEANIDLSRLPILARSIKKEFTQLCGNDDIALGFNAQGGTGCISVSSNVFPEICTKIQKLWQQGDWNGAFCLQKLLSPLYQALSCDTNPVPIKYAAHLIGMCSPDVRLPLTPLSERHKKLIEHAMKHVVEEINTYEQQSSKEYCSSKS